ncbi:MAG: prepilin-type N-terminal cleavage/methylation domain-containing protein [Pirellulales bacterium]
MNGKRRGRFRISDFGFRIKRRRNCNPQSAIHNPQFCSAFTLLEVILAIAVLAIALASIGEVMRMAYQSADSAAAESEAQILAESILGELATGMRPAQAVQTAPLDLGDGRDDEWQYSILIEPTMRDEIVMARVVVESVRENTQKPPRVELAQWFLNPDMVPSGSNTNTGATGTPSSGVTESGQ